MASYDIVGIHDAEAECGLYLNAEYEGRGLASMVQAVMEQKVREMGILLLRMDLKRPIATVKWYIWRKR